MKKNILVAMILTLAEISYSQNYIDGLSLPRPDCSGKIWNSFYDNQNKIMVLSDVYLDDAEYKRMYGYFLLDSTLVAKKESELTEDDYKKPLLIFGPVMGFKNWGHDTSIVNNNIKVLQKYLDYDMTDIVKMGDSQSFWGGPSENNWPIAYPLSGLFVKYLIDNWGLELFKKIYGFEDKNIAFRKIYDKSVDELIMDFRNNVLQN